MRKASCSPGRIDRIGVVLFNQPEKRNALSLAMWDGVVRRTR
jgi:enoyl-CoA hydratase/carnithine racemase